jgi:hypothetical protein
MSAVTTELNQRPRRTLKGQTPAQALERLLSDRKNPLLRRLGLPRVRLSLGVDGFQAAFAAV